MLIALRTGPEPIYMLGVHDAWKSRNELHVFLAPTCLEEVREVLLEHVKVWLWCVEKSLKVLLLTPGLGERPAPLGLHLG